MAIDGAIPLLEAIPSYWGAFRSEKNEILLSFAFLTLKDAIPASEKPRIDPSEGQKSKGPISGYYRTLEDYDF